MRKRILKKNPPKGFSNKRLLFKKKNQYLAGISFKKNLEKEKVTSIGKNTA